MFRFVDSLFLKTILKLLLGAWQLSLVTKVEP